MLNNLLDFQSLQYNPMGIPSIREGGSVFAEYPVLNRLQEVKEFWKKRPDERREFAMRYVLLMYQKDTPLFAMYPKLDKRKEKAYEIIAGHMGYELPKGLKEAIFEFNEDTFTDMVVSFVRFQNDRDWQMIVTIEQLIYETHKRILSAIVIEDEKDEIAALEKKDKLMQSLDKHNKSLDAYYARLSQNDKPLGDKIRQVATGMITPEQIAESLELTDDV